MIEIPTVPLAVMVLLGFLAPYAVAFLNGVLPFVTKPFHRKIVAVAVSIVLAVAGLVGYFLVTGTPLPASGAEWVGFVLLVLVVSQASYALVTKNLGADQIEQRVGGDGDDAKAARHLSKFNGN